jgi:lambda family phage portal protein
VSENFDHLFDGMPSDASGGAVTVPAAPSGDMAMGAFEGADRLNSSIALWDSPLQSVDLDVLPEKGTIDGRARDMTRNDAFVQGGVNLHKDNIVGAHYLANCRPSSRIFIGQQDDVWEEEFQEEVEEKWGLFADSPDNWVDAARTNDFTSLIRLGVGVHTVAGEMLATAEWIRDDGAPLSTAIQMVDLDRLCDPQDANYWNVALSPNHRSGIRYNNRGAPQSYFIRSSHPNDYGPVTFEMPTWKEVSRVKPWGRLQVIHLFEQNRPDQSRGVTEMAAALKAMKITHTFRDIQVQNAVTQALYAAAITSSAPDAQIFQQIGGGNLDPAAVAKAVAEYSEGYLRGVAKYAGNARGMQIDGVKIPRLYPGEKLELLAPGNSGPLGTEFEQSLLRYIAASLGVSYEQLSRDYTQTNYSSARAAMAETWKFMQSRKKLVADRFASIIFRLWLEEAINKNEIFALPARLAPRLYTGGRLNLVFDAVSRVDWIGASRGQIDEYKETQAAVLRITNGLSTAEEELARLGKDWRKVYRQLKREQDLRATLGLMFTGTDPSVLAANAKAMAQNQNSDDSDKEAA